METKETIESLSAAHRQRLKEASAALKICAECQGKPQLSYEPGTVYSVCPMNKKNCPCLAAAPDLELEELVGKINERKPEK